MNETELLLDRALYRMQPTERGRLMAECPVAYFRHYVGTRDVARRNDLIDAIVSAVRDQLNAEVCK